MSSSSEIMRPINKIKSITQLCDIIITNSTHKWGSKYIDFK